MEKEIVTYWTVYDYFNRSYNHFVDYRKANNFVSKLGLSSYHIFENHKYETEEIYMERILKNRENIIDEVLKIK
jgi:hypothetical protein